MRSVPVPRTPLRGREAALARLSELVAAHDGSIVTLVGPGGSGKTRLALELCARAADGDGEVRFVDLREARDASGVVSAIAASLGLAENPGQDQLERVASFLRHGSQLVVLDNMEQVVEAGPTVAALASSCPEVGVVVTSRRRLNVRAERVLVVRPLEASPAAALFCERAVAVSGRDFAGDAVTIGEICRRLDGLPLAIELAAAYCRLLSPAALLDRLCGGPTDTLALLDRAARDVPEHHRGLRAAMSVSYELLDVDARRVLRALAVFEGGWSLDAMEAVCGADVSAMALWDGLVELVDLHLVDAVDTGSSEARFRMLETVRQFAAALLVGAGESADLERRHAEFFVAFALAAGPRLESRDALATTNDIDRDLANIRAALDWMEHAGRVDEALAATVALGWFWRYEGLGEEGRRRLDRLLVVTAADDATRAKADAWSARLGFTDALDRAGKLRVVERLEAARDVLAAAGDRVGHLRVSSFLVVVSRFVGDYERAVDVALAALQGDVEEPFAWLRADVLRGLAEVRRAQGLLAEARELAVEAERQADTVGNVLAATEARMTRLLVEPVARRTVDPEVLFDECVEVRNWHTAAIVASVLSADDVTHGELAGAARWADRAVELAVRSGSSIEAPFAMMVGLFTASAAGRHQDVACISGVLRPADAWLMRALSPGVVRAYRAAVDAARAALGDAFEVEHRAGERLDWMQAVDDVRAMLAEVGAQTLTAATATRPGRRRGPRANPNPTDRELQILYELARGGTNQTIAEVLQISPKTVMHHAASIYRKLGVRGRAEAVAVALRTGLVSTQHAG